MSRSVLLVIGQEGIGGITEGIIPYLQVLDRRRYQVAVAVPPGAGADQFRSLGIRVVECRIRHALDLTTVPALLRVMAEVRADLVRTHMLVADIPGTAAGRLARVPVIKSFHGWLRTDKRVNDAVYERLEAFACHASVRVTAESLWARDSLVTRLGLPADKIVVIPPSVNSRFLEPRGVDRRQVLQSVRRGGPTVTLVGRLARQKGQRFAIGAMPAVLERSPHCRLLLVGTGPDEEKLRQLSRDLNVQHAVRFMGQRRDIPDILSRSDVALVPSLWEEFGLVNIEAMAMGKPVVASNVDSIPEIIVDGVTGLLVPPGDARALAAAILRLIGDERLAARLGDAGRSRVAAHYTPHRYCQRTVDLYDQILSS